MKSDFDRFAEELQEQGFRVSVKPTGSAVISTDGIPVAIIWNVFDDIAVRRQIHRMRELGFIWPPPKRE